MQHCADCFVSALKLVAGKYFEPAIGIKHLVQHPLFSKPPPAHFVLWSPMFPTSHLFPPAEAQPFFTCLVLPCLLFSSLFTPSVLWRLYRRLVQVQKVDTKSWYCLYFAWNAFELRSMVPFAVGSSPMLPFEWWTRIWQGDRLSMLCRVVPKAKDCLPRISRKGLYAKLSLRAEVKPSKFYKVYTVFSTLFNWTIFFSSPA